MNTVYQQFASTAAKYGADEFLYIDAVTAATYGMSTQSISWGEAAQRVEALVSKYKAAGYGHGHRVGLLLENRPEFILHWMALNALGASVVPMSAEMRSAELTYLIGHSEIVLAVSIPSRVEALEEAVSLANSSAAVFAFDSGEDIPKCKSNAPEAGEPGLQTECALLYTSGTTGRPKGCRLTNSYYLRAGRFYANLDGVATYEAGKDRVLTPLPLNHVNAMAFSTMVVITAGGCLIQLDRFHPKSWWKSVRDSRATIIHYLGVMPAMLLSVPESESDKDLSVRWAFGAGVDKKNHAVFEKRFGFPLIEGWAMTETGAAAVIKDYREPRQVGTSCIGWPNDWVEIRIVDEAGNDVPDEANGELLVRAAGADPRKDFFSGYLKDEKATEEAWAGGWLHTGDLVHRDKKGSLHFVDRKKNVIRRSGENISAVEVESVLMQHPMIKSVGIAAAPDEVRGDEVLACVIPSENVPENQREEVAKSIVDWALKQLAYFKAPGYVAFVDSLPLTASQKIQRGQLKDLAQSMPGRSNCVDTRAMKKRQA